MAEIVQTLVRRQGERYVAECFDFPFHAESDTLDGALAEIERLAREYFEARKPDSAATSEPAFLLAVALYFGPFQFA
jgi:hypothetical protein